MAEDSVNETADDVTSGGEDGPSGPSATVRPRKLRRRKRRFRLFSWGFFAFLCVLALFLPTSLTIETPGPTLNVLGKISEGSEDTGTKRKAPRRDVIEISGVRTHRDPGRLLMVTVNANGIPGQPALVAEALWGWLDPSAAVYPRELFFPSGQTTKQYDAKQRDEMTGAQSSAASEAVRFLRARGYKVSGSQIHLTAGDIGGPSAGLMFTLGIIDKVTPQSETGGRTIAGTGTISKGGKVGQIGGITKKLLAAKRDGAMWFLVPASNCSEAAGHVPSGLRDVRVSTLSEAYDAVVRIGRGQGDSLPHCTVSRSAASAE